MSSTKTVSYRLGKLDNPKTLSASDAPYWAAMIDGEGCICVIGAGKGRPNYRMFVNITNTNFELLDRLAAMIGVGALQVGARANPKWKTRGQLILNHEAADFVLRQTFPYLIAKKEQARLAMEFMHLKRAWSRTNDNHLEQAAISAKVKALNARGKVNEIPIHLEAFGHLTRSCSAPGCVEKHYGNGYCRRHYRWAYESKGFDETFERKCEQCGDALAPNARVDTKFCSTSCKMKHHRRKGCYTPEALADAPKCSEDGCDRPRHAKGLCRRHYMQRWHASQS